jgi:isoleucyl-tRNA synthetase
MPARKPWQVANPTLNNLASVRVWPSQRLRNAKVSMFEKVSTDAGFVRGEHDVLKFWNEAGIFDRLRAKNAGKPRWSFLDGPITANNPMGVHHAWGRTYKDAYQRFFAMTGHDQRYQNGFDCQGLWVEVEVEKELSLGTKSGIAEFGIDKFVKACKQRVLTFAARQTEQSIRLGYWMDWDDPDTLRRLAAVIGDQPNSPLPPGEGLGVRAGGVAVGSNPSQSTPSNAPLSLTPALSRGVREDVVTITTPSGKTATGTAEELVSRLGNPEWGGSYFTFSTENNETIWTFLKKCHQRGKIYRGFDVMPWSGRGGSAYSQMEVAEGRKLTTHKSVFVRFLIVSKSRESRDESREDKTTAPATSLDSGLSTLDSPEFLLVWTTTPWTLTSNVAAAVNPNLDYVRLKAKRDGAVYYFAKDNLEFQRLSKEFKEGFGRPEWTWPKGVAKLKTIAQLFKEQGGYEILGTIKGAEMIGWRYAGPFDDLPAQSFPGGFPENEAVIAETGVSGHRVVDGGRDSEGNQLVVAGEGTGIVHIAPGCGDVDFVLGKSLGIVAIAPLGEDGCFLDGFGMFTGREAIDKSTPELVFDELRRKELLVAVEDYPHIYPHCWRTGEELVFRAVDEWFINMDWRQEIMDVVKQIRWLPDSIDGQTREVEWLTNMRDWMISKKRFWGLALPIWVDDETGDFEVIGSLAELQERAVEGWDEFAGHTPHRPWIDKVKLRNPKTGNLMTRVPDVGNPWLDAGIVPFSTMHYNSNRDEWRKWFPADLVTECFPGQFRNWFYSLLSLATMMRYDETDDAVEKRPFKTLLGHRLVTNQDGKPMHKTDGTAIWFEEAAEQLGVDTIRWLYLAQNPASDLRFGLRHPDKPVTLQTPEGPISTTKEGAPTCEVTSKPADEVRRMVLIPLWNSYAFFVNYARLDEFDPTPVLDRSRLAPRDESRAPADVPNSHANSASEADSRGGNPLAEREGYIPVADRPEIDRWVLSNLHVLIETARREMQDFNAPGFLREAAHFIDDLSNWYIRRNRRRFWRSRDAGDQDKLAAYQTLYEVLLTLAKLLAPVVPFVAERMYRNLVVATVDLAGHPSPPAKNPLPKGERGESECESVHLCDYPVADPALIDHALSERMALAQLLVNLGHGLREQTGHRVRQPLAELRFACGSPAEREAISRLADVIQEELNVKQITACENLDDLVSYLYKPNLKTLGPKFGKSLGAIGQALATADGKLLAPLRRGETVTLSIGGADYALNPEDVLVSTQQAADWVAADDRGVQVALSTVLTPDLIQEGIARDFVRQVQQLRKDADLEIQNRIRVFYFSDSNDVRPAVTAWVSYILGETLADVIEFSSNVPANAVTVQIGDVQVQVWIEKACA